MTAEFSDLNWPLPKFYFLVDWGNQTNIQFQEVSGLDIEAQTIEYRHGNSPVFSEINMPGIVKNSNVTLKKGIFTDDNEFWNWYNLIKMNTIKRQTIVIKLIDESGNPTMIWTLNNAWPTKISSTDQRSDGNEVSVESIEIMHEGLTITNS